VMHTSRRRRNFTVRRKIYIPKPPDAPKKVEDKSTSALMDGAFGRLIGSFVLLRPGQVVFDCPAFHTEQSIYPADYTCVRLP
jgi:hypothetical protein